MLSNKLVYDLGGERDERLPMGYLREDECC